MAGLLGHNLGLVEGAGVLESWHVAGILGIPGHAEICDPSPFQ